MTSDPKLLRWYRAFNLQYFAGELPDVELSWEPCGCDAANTSAIQGTDDELMIRMDPALLAFPRHAKKDLLHEMVHVRLWKDRGLADHGRRFDAEIKRLCGHRSYRNLL